jgi:hypothetical protein
LVSRLCNDLITGTVTSPASGTFVCAETDWEQPDDHFNHFKEVYDYSGTNAGTSGNPYDWDHDTYTLTFKPAATLTAGDEVEMHERFKVDAYNDFINLAVEMVAKEALIHKVDETITLAASTYKYDLPTQFLWISGIYLESSTSGVYNEEDPINPKYYRVVNTSTIQVEFIKELWTPTADRHLRVVGFASPSKLDTDTEECPLNPAFVTYQAAALAHQSLIRGQEKDSEYHSQQMQLCQTMADRVRDTMNVSVGGAKAVIET